MYYDTWELFFSSQKRITEKERDGRDGRFRNDGTRKDTEDTTILVQIEEVMCVEDIVHVVRQ